VFAPDPVPGSISLTAGAGDRSGRAAHDGFHWLRRPHGQGRRLVAGWHRRAGRPIVVRTRIRRHPDTCDPEPSWPPRRVNGLIDALVVDPWNSYW